jgi:Rhodopirellula transposase DDE domain
LARATIRVGHGELAARVRASGRLRRAGAGRPDIEETQAGITDALDRLVAPLTRGDPMSPLRWTCKSTAKLAGALAREDYDVSATTVGRLLRTLGYRQHALQKAREGAAHPDRDAQFEHINATAALFIAQSQPVISVDTKKKELVGDFKVPGREWQPTGTPERVRVHDFPGEATGKAIPYGVYDMARNEAWVSVGRDHDTPAFAVAAIRQWWTMMGRRAYPRADTLYITADAGGSNGYRSRGWKVALQRLADTLGLTIHVSHFPPGTSKWNKVEHRLFCHITQNWRGRPLRTFETVVELIGHTRTAAGLRVKAKLDKRRYRTGRVISRAEMRSLDLQRHAFHGDWNYALRPRPT